MINKMDTHRSELSSVFSITRDIFQVGSLTLCLVIVLAGRIRGAILLYKLKHTPELTLQSHSSHPDAKSPQRAQSDDPDQMFSNNPPANAKVKQMKAGRLRSHQILNTCCSSTANLIAITLHFLLIP